MSTDNVKIRLVASFIQFLTEELGSEELSGDAKESIEVAIQCLEQAFGVNPVDGTLPSKKPLLEIFASNLDSANKQEPIKTISAEEKARADTLKNEGNNLMKANQFQEALDAYTKAIEIDDTNPIYYCNRAAAYSKMERHIEALNDCQIAIKRDPSYSKAYCRMGLAYVNLNDPQRARDSYKKAVELDPSEGNLNNLRLAEQKVAEQQAQCSQGFNVANILNNPALMNMANQMMTDPNMQNMISSLMGNIGGGGSANVSESSPAENIQPPTGEGDDGLAAFLKVGQEIAAQMQAANPALVEQLKTAFKKNKEQEENAGEENNKKEPSQDDEGNKSQ